MRFVGQGGFDAALVVPTQAASSQGASQYMYASTSSDLGECSHFSICPADDDGQTFKIMSRTSTDGKAFMPSSSNDAGAKWGEDSYVFATSSDAEAPVAWTLVSHAASPVSRARTLSNDSTDSESKCSAYSGDELAHESNAKLGKDADVFGGTATEEKYNADTLFSSVGNQLLRSQFIML